MINRRELIASTVALSVAAQASAARTAAPASGGTVRSAGPTRPTSQGIESPAKYFVASRDLPDAHAAARATEALGATVVWLGADVTPVYTRLDLELRSAPCAVAGLTSAHHLFVLERLGWDRGLRTARRTELGTMVEWRLEPRKVVTEKGSDTFSHRNIVPGT